MKRILVISLFVFSTLSASANDLANIQVSGSGSVEALPDYINLHISVEKTDLDRAVAKNQADVVTQQVLEAIASTGIEDKHVQASQLFISPQYRWNEQSRVLIGQRAVRSVQIKLYDLDSYSALADKLVNLDITQMHQPGFGFDNIETHQNQALIEALRNAREKAEVIAKEIGRKLGATFQVSEFANYSAPVMRSANMQMMAESADALEPAPLEIRKQTITTSINVIFLLD